MSEETHFSNEHFTIALLKAPRCKAVINNTSVNTCQCLQNFLTLIENRDRSTNFKKCGSGDMQLQITRTDNTPITIAYIQQYTHYLNNLIQDIFQATDSLHIKEGGRAEALEYNEKIKSFEIYLHRGLPEKIAKNYPQVSTTKIRPTDRRS